MNIEFAELWEKLNHTPLYIDQTSATIELNKAEVENFYLPIARWLLQESAKQTRYLVCIAGPPGSGKSIFSIVLARIINILLDSEIAICIGLDGWHYSNAYLESHQINHNGIKTTLRAIKGGPETYDARLALSKLKEIKDGAETNYPIYSREIHEPVLLAGYVKKSCKVILIEGNYLLLDDPPWDSFKALFDTTIFLKVDTEKLLTGLKERHLRGGKTRQVVENHVANVDLPNILKVQPSIKHAQMIVEKADNRHMTGISWR